MLFWLINTQVWVWLKIMNDREPVPSENKIWLYRIFGHFFTSHWRVIVQKLSSEPFYGYTVPKKRRKMNIILKIYRKYGCIEFRYLISLFYPSVIWSLLICCTHLTLPSIFLFLSLSLSFSPSPSLSLSLSLPLSFSLSPSFFLYCNNVLYSDVRSKSSLSSYLY